MTYRMMVVKPYSLAIEISSRGEAGGKVSLFFSLLSLFFGNYSSLSPLSFSLSSFSFLLPPPFSLLTRRLSLLPPPFFVYRVVDSSSSSCSSRSREREERREMRENEIENFFPLAGFAGLTCGLTGAILTGAV